jgi:hypothetical protein
LGNLLAGESVFLGAVSTVYNFSKAVLSIGTESTAKVLNTLFSTASFGNGFHLKQNKNKNESQITTMNLLCD